MEFITKLKLEDKVVVTDPCYCYEPNQRGIILLENVQAGEYNCFVELKNKRVKEAIVLLTGLYQSDYYVWHQVGFVEVDSGQAGIFNFSFHEEMKAVKENDRKKWEKDYYDKISTLTCIKDAINYKDNSFITSTGWGDGEYEIFIAKKDDKIVGIQIVYFENEEDD